MSWDEPLDDEFISKWHQIATDIEDVQTVMKRRYSVMSTDQCVNLHMLLMQA